MSLLAIAVLFLGFFIFLGACEIASALRTAIPRQVDFVNSGTSRQIHMSQAEFEKWEPEVKP